MKTVTLRRIPVPDVDPDANQELILMPNIAPAVISPEKQEKIRILQSEMLRAYQCLSHHFGVIPMEQIPLRRGDLVPWLVRIKDASMELINILDGRKE
jgi:hypothetical protein